MDYNAKLVNFVCEKRKIFVLDSKQHNGDLLIKPWKEIALGVKSRKWKIL
jgi:hypothetical protein